MPSAEALARFSDGMYYCQYEGCKQVKGYALECQLRKHILTHIRPVKCSRCSYAAADKKGVFRHVKVAHRALAEALCGPEQRSVCPICQTEFTRKDNFQKHYKAQHSR